MISSPGWQARARHAVVLALALATLMAVPVVGQTAEPSPAVTSPEPEPWKLVALGDSLPRAHFSCPACKGFIELYADAITDATGVPVDVDNRTNVQHSGVSPVQASHLLHRILTDASLREAIADADIVVVNVGHNDTPWNRWDNPCEASDPSATDIERSMITDACTDRVLNDYKRTLDDIFAQIDILRGCMTQPFGEPLTCTEQGHEETMLRMATVYDDWIGWPGAPTAEPVTARVNQRWVDAQCWVVRMHGGECADVYHVLNGPDGTKDAAGFLDEEHTHLNPRGHQLVADELARLGYRPLR
jgi:lysophospholipase L1-like esterase